MKAIAKMVVVGALALITACGGGGSSGGGNAVVADVVIASADPQSGTYLPALATGSFTIDGAKYVLSAGWIATSASGPASPLAPIKVLKINSDNTATDATTAILGGPQLASTNIPLVADFNGDGIDDIFLVGFRDFPVVYTAGVVFLSRAGLPHQRVDLTELVWSHGANAVDIDGDGDIDVINNRGQMWLNDGHGNFTFRDYAYNLNNTITDGTYMGGSGICTGDFNNTGRKQVVMTDVSNTSLGLPIADTIIFELDAQLRSTAYHVLPVPVLDRGKTIETSHDVACQVADLNGDGKLDIIVMSRPSDSDRNGNWTDEGRIQVYLNQGGWVFTDITDTITGYDMNVLVSYTPIITDLNNDGKLDVWLGYFDGTTGLANQAMLNTGNTVFTRTMKSTIDAYASTGPMIPVKFGNQWSLVYSKRNVATRGYTYYISGSKIQF